MERNLSLINNEADLNKKIFGYKVVMLANRLKNMTEHEFNLKIQVFPKTMQTKIIKIKRENFDFKTLAKLIIIREGLKK